MKRLCYICIYLFLISISCNSSSKAFKKNGVIEIIRIHSENTQVFDFEIFNSSNKRTFFYWNDFFHGKTRGVKNVWFYNNLPMMSSIEFPITLVKLKPKERKKVQFKFKEPIDSLVISFSYLTSIKHCSEVENKTDETDDYFYTTTMCFFDSYRQITTFEESFKLK